MQIIDSVDSLRTAILQLEDKQSEERRMMKEQFLVAYESIKPLNFIMSTIKEVTESPELKDNLLNTAVGVATGFVTKALFVGLSGSPLRKLLGAGLMFGVTNVVTKHPDAIRSLGKELFKIASEKFAGNLNGTVHNESR